MKEKEMKMKSDGSGAGNAAGKGEGFAEKKAKMENLMSAGDDAIGKSVSINSESFLSQNRQVGGQ